MTQSIIIESWFVSSISFDQVDSEQRKLDSNFSLLDICSWNHEIDRKETKKMFSLSMYIVQYSLIKWSIRWKRRWTILRLWWNELLSWWKYVICWTKANIENWTRRRSNDWRKRHQRWWDWILCCYIGRYQWILLLRLDHHVWKISRWWMTVANKLMWRIASCYIMSTFNMFL